jgi:hypothetical protein
MENFKQTLQDSQQNTKYSLLSSGNYQLMTDGMSSSKSPECHWVPKYISTEHRIFSSLVIQRSEKSKDPTYANRQGWAGVQVFSLKVGSKPHLFPAYHPLCMFRTYHWSSYLALKTSISLIGNQES